MACSAMHAAMAMGMVTHAVAPASDASMAATMLRGRVLGDAAVELCRWVGCIAGAGEGQRQTMVSGGAVPALVELCAASVEGAGRALAALLVTEGEGGLVAGEAVGAGRRLAMCL